MSTIEQSRFKNGQQLSDIVFPNEDSFRVGRNGCIGIWIMHENGQMAAVPWAVVDFEGGRIEKVNLAHVSSCELAKEQSNV